MLKEIVSMFIEALTSSLEAVPYGIRWICKAIRNLTKEHFPEATQQNTTSLIGGFFLLRFVNPAIVTPDVSGLDSRDCPSRWGETDTLAEYSMQLKCKGLLVTSSLLTPRSVHFPTSASLGY